MKLAAVIGFCAGFPGVFYVLITMGMLIVAYALLSRTNAVVAMKNYIPLGRLLPVLFCSY